MPPKKVNKDTKATEPEVQDVEDSQIETSEVSENFVSIVVPPYRVRRADTNNVVIEKLKKRQTSDDTYWDVEGYYNNHAVALTKLFYKDISAENVASIRELIEKVKVSERNIIKALQDIQDVKL